jgi:hypothetical protein
MCLSPWLKTDVKNGRKDMLPCGRCPECTARRTSAWSFRLTQEDKRSLSSLFITLTYDNLNVPITKRGYMTVSKKDVQLFMKRLRKANKNKLKYYLAAEYGGKTKRPHYHIILFNADVRTIAKAWNLGEIHFGEVTGASIGYTLKYISKPSRIPEHKNDDRTPEFSLMSKRIGNNYLTDPMIRWHKADLENRLYCVIDEKKITMPRYYKDKIYTDAERLRIKYHHQNIIAEKEEKLNASRQRIDEIEQAKIAAFKKQIQKSKQNCKL